MAARDTYNGAVAVANATFVASETANEQARQTTIDGAKSVVGYTLQTGNYAALAAATASANAARAAARLSAIQAKQSAIQTARDTLRSTGDLAP